VAAEVIMIDTSGTMAGTKVHQACQAATKAIEVLRDGTYFAVVAGWSSARSVYPAHGMARASTVTRKEAARALTRVKAAGGTSMSTWLALTGELLAGVPAQIKHAIMLTDGQNIEGDVPLRAALRACEGKFICDCRGIGDDWSYVQLREIARTLLGTWKPVAAPDLLADDFRAVMTATMEKRAAGVFLRVSPAGGGRVSYFARVMPTIDDLTAKGVARDPRALEFPLGDWGAQVADYHLCIEVGQRELNVETGGRARAARVAVVVPAASGGGPESVVGTGSVGVCWTTDVSLSGPLNPRVAGYAGQEELAEAVDQGLAAWKSESADAMEKLGRAVRLAHECGREDLLEKLSTMVQIEDPATGRIRLRPRGQVAPGAENWSSFTAEESRYVDADDPDGTDPEQGGDV
jgi:hypothetical protein